MSKVVAIFAPNGQQCAPVVTEALSQGLTVRAVSRNIEKTKETHPGAIAVQASLDNEDAVASALEGVDAAFLLLPIPSSANDTPTWASTFLKAAKRASLPLLVYATGGPAGNRYPEGVSTKQSTDLLNSFLSSTIPTIGLISGIYLENLKNPGIAPSLHAEGILTYPPVNNLTFQWTSHADQGRIGAAALQRPDLAGKVFEVGTPDALTGHELAKLLRGWVGREVTYQPLTPQEFGDSMSAASGNPALGFILSDLYGSINKLEGNAMKVDTDALESTFKVKLTSVADEIAKWKQ